MAPYTQQTLRNCLWGTREAQGGTPTCGKCHRKENSLAFRDPALNTNRNLTRQSPLCRLRGTNQVSQRKPMACELTVDAEDFRNDMLAHICL